MTTITLYEEISRLVSSIGVGVACRSRLCGWIPLKWGERESGGGILDLGLLDHSSNFFTIIYLLGGRTLLSNYFIQTLFTTFYISEIPISLFSQSNRRVLIPVLHLIT